MAYTKGQILTVKTSGSNLNMRNAANSSGALVTSIPDGSSVTATTGALVTGAGSSKGWLEVTYSGKTGYVASDYLVAPAATTATTTTTSTTTAPASKVLYPSGVTLYAKVDNGVNLRQTPTTSGLLIATLAKGKNVKVKDGTAVMGAGSTAGWIKVETGIYSGYVASEQMTTTKPATITATTATTTAAMPAATPSPSAVLSIPSPSATIAPDATPMVTEADSKSKMRKMLVIGGVAIAAVVAFFAFKKLKK